jgi:hypothetical protein
VRVAAPDVLGARVDHDPADIGAVAVKALTEPGHEGKADVVADAVERAQSGDL